MPRKAVRAELFAASTLVLAAIVAPGAAFAAEAAAEAVPQTGASLEEVVVTAQRRSETMQDVPIAVTALTGASLQAKGVTDLTSLGQLTPGLNVQLQAGNLRPTIRGVGGPVAQGVDSSVATFIDGVYQGAGGNLYDMDDTDHVEVARGPQGTLFGRNATGGIVQIFTKGPSQQFAAKAKAGYASFDTVFGSAFVTGPVTKNLSLSLAAQGRDQRDGWARDVATGQPTSLGSSYTFRGKALLEWGESSSLLVAGNYSWNNYNYSQNYDPLPGTLSSGGQGNLPNFGNAAVPADNRQQIVTNYSAELHHGFSWADFVNIAAYHRGWTQFNTDNDAAPAVISYQRFFPVQAYFTEEARLQSPAGTTLGGRSFNWLVGVYYLDQDYRSSSITQGSAVTAMNLAATQLNARQKSKSLSSFVDATYAILPKTKLSVGLRYTDDQSDLTEAYVTQVLPTGATRVIPQINATPNTHNSVLTYRAVLQQEFTPDIMGYVSYSKGYKAGGFGLLSPTAAPVEPEYLKSAEVGLKTNFFDNRLRANIAAYHYDYTNMQVRVNGRNAQGLPAIITINAAAAKVKGVELELAGKPTEHLLLNANFSLADGTYTKFPNGPVVIPNPASCTPVPIQTGPAKPGATACSADLAGNRIVNIPRVSMNLGADYSMPLDGGSSIDFAVNYYHTAKFYWDPDNRDQQSAYSITNASATWNAPSGRWRAQLYVHNLFDKRYAIYINQSLSNYSSSPAEPRTVGAFVAVDF